MKRINFILCAFGLALSAMSLGSCNNNDYYDYGYLRPTAVVTVRPQADGSFFMQLDDFTVIYPDNMDKSPFGDKEVRALVTTRRALRMTQIPNRRSHTHASTGSTASAPSSP